MKRTWGVKGIAGCLVVTALSLWGAPSAAAQDPTQEPQESAGTEAALVAASTVLTVVHVPMRLALCGVVTVLGGVSYLATFGSPPVARDMADLVKGVCGGPYVVTPKRLQGRDTPEKPHDAP